MPVNDAPAPGLYFLHAPERAPSGVRGRSLPAPLGTVGAFRAGVAGRLGSHAARGGWHLFFDGALTHGRERGQSDAATALGAFLENSGTSGGGFDALHALEGFYNAILLHEREPRAHFFSDPLSSRAWYLYRRGRAVAAAPTPLAFARWGLPMSLDRLELFHTFRFMHSCLGRTLAEEVERLQPGLRYTLRERAPMQTRRYRSFAHRPDPDVTLDESVERMKTFFGDVTRGLLTHPRLAGRPVHLPLTAGLDSRHILGELLEQDCPPAALHHIQIEDADYQPVREMAAGLGLELHAPTLADLDWPRVLRRWAARSGGLVSVHQSYLLGMIAALPRGGEALMLGGYLMDGLMTISPWTALPEGTGPAEHVWNQRYTRPGMLRLLFPDRGALADESFAHLRAAAARFDGPRWYRAVLLAMHQRGLHYTGPLDPLFADDALHFSPGAHVRSLDYFRTVPRAVAGDRKARLEALRRHFPDLAAYPGPDGRSYRRKDRLLKTAASRSQYVRPWLEAIRSGFRKDPAPESEHAWLRHIAPLRRVHRAAARESALVEDGHLRGLGPRASWLLLHAGGYQGWTLMSLLTAEVAYRLLMRQEPLSDVLGRLFEEGRR